MILVGGAMCLRGRCHRSKGGVIGPGCYRSAVPSGFYSIGDATIKCHTRYLRDANFIN